MRADVVVWLRMANGGYVVPVFFGAAVERDVMLSGLLECLLPLGAGLQGCVGQVGGWGCGESACAVFQLEVEAVDGLGL